jgi:diguanylate cyclase (GGDEF)-like protein
MSFAASRVVEKSPDLGDEAFRRTAVFSAAIIFAAAGVLNLVEELTPGGPTIEPTTGAAAIAIGLLIAALGQKLPTAVLALLGPLGTAMIAYAVATSDGPGDGAILYVWPVLWESYFFGRRGAIGIVVCVAVAHGLALLSMSQGLGYWDRWQDVVVSVGVTATVVAVLAGRNRRLIERLTQEARVDNLTGLLNRRGFAECAAAELVRARRDGSSLALVSFDLDNFKVVNDEWGHQIGDRVLVAVSRLIESHLREVDVLARVGGEEFLALLPDTDVDAGQLVAERVRSSLVEWRGPDPGLPKVTVSAGVAAAAAPADIEQLLKAADRGLYAAKGSGRNRTVVAERRSSRAKAPPARHKLPT